MKMCMRHGSRRSRKNSHQVGPGVQASDPEYATLARASLTITNLSKAEAGWRSGREDEVMVELQNGRTALGSGVLNIFTSLGS